MSTPADRSFRRPGYQYDFAQGCPAMYDVAGRERKARTMVAVLDEYFNGRLRDLVALNVGSSAGIIDNLLADHLRMVIGIDIDRAAVRYAHRAFHKRNLYFQVGDALHIPFPDGAFDVVVCSQVYEHVADAERLMVEVRRVLRVGGICYFAANNRVMWMEPHHRLPLLSILPGPIADRYVRWAGKGDRYHEKHRSHRGLRRLVRGFRVHDFTARIVADPERYGAGYMVGRRHLTRQIGRLVAERMKWACPGFIWVLEKRPE